MQNPVTSSENAAIEVEQKFHVRDVAELERRLSQAGAGEGSLEHHCDTYYRHPSRDFAQTREALRIRRVVTQAQAGGGDGSENSDADESATLVTYKGPYQLGGIKARPELQWRIDPCDPDGTNMASLLNLLGFAEVLTVRKTRRPFYLDQSGKQLVIAIDDAHGLGMFAEIETIATSLKECDACGEIIARIAEQLGLRDVEKRSYLQMALEQVGLGGCRRV